MFFLFFVDFEVGWELVFHLFVKRFFAKRFWREFGKQCGDLFQGGGFEKRFENELEKGFESKFL